MGYFDGLANAAFKQDAQGRELFFPHGMMGKGRVLPDAETAAALRAKLVNFYKLLMFGGIPLVVVAIGLPGGKPVVIVLAVLLCLAAWFWLRQLTKDYPIADERMTYGEAQRNAARGHSYLGLILLSLMSWVFVMVGILLVMVGEPEGRLVGIASVVLFGAALCLFLWMIVAKRRQSRP
jgi:Flp pilus assembly protein TadB